MRRRGFSLPETLIAAVLLTVGVAAVAATIILSLRMIADSEAVTTAQQTLRNDAEKYLLKISLLHEDAPEISDK
ncbi:MAG: prepilin-type N-terminal cleavage/methylation domain-containing protein, partial [Cloacibacillus sp.]